jgi:membrane-associated phospholipid phosphatase
MEKYLKKKQVLLMVGIFILGFAFAFCAGIIKKHCSVIEWNGSTGDFCLSWPSGHSANCFNIIAFVVFWFVLRHSDSKLKKPFIVLFFMAGITVMVLRMLSGNHFLTDVLSGAAIGFVCGFSMDFLCNKIFAKKMEEL